MAEQLPAGPVLNRRRLFAGAAGVFGVSLFGPSLLTACASGDPAPTPGPAGPQWFEPTVRASSDGKLATRLRVASEEVTMGGSRVQAVSYEGTYPGPTLDLRPGDRLEVDLVNDSDEATNLHTHGLHVSPQSPSDNVLLTVNPGETYAYSYDIPDDHPAGTYWYHAHFHTISDKQVFGGQFGLLILRGALDELPGVAGLTERVIIISQTEIVDGGIKDGADSALDVQVTLVNGTYQPTAQIAPGEVQRWRILNSSSLFLRLRLDGHQMHTIAIDGNPLTATQTSEVLVLVPGARADVLVQGGAEGSYELQSLSWEEFGVFYTSMVPVPQPLLTLESRGEAATPAALPTELLPFEDLRDAQIDRRRTFVFEELEPRGTGHNEHFRYYINGTQFDHHVVNETMNLGDTEEWEFINRTYEPHPIHIHVNPFQVVSIDGEPVEEPHLRDTAMLPPFGSLVIRHRFEDFTGVFVMHCHILFHEDHGMMQLLEVVDPNTA